MAIEDSVPVLTNSDSVEQEKVLPLTDSMMERGLGIFGWLEFVQCILVSFAMFFEVLLRFSHPV